MRNSFKLFGRKASGKPGRQFHYFLVSYLLIMILPVMLGCITYVKAIATVKQQTKEYNTILLGQASQIIDGYLTGVNQVMSNVAFDSGIKGFLNTSSVEIPDDILSMKSIMKQLDNYNQSQLAYTDNVVYDLYVYFKNIDSILAQTGKYTPSQYYSKIASYKGLDYNAWKQTLEQGVSGRFLPAQDIAAGAFRKNVITYVQTLPPYEKNRIQGVACILVDTEKIEKQMRNTGILEDGAVYIFDNRSKQVISALGNQGFLTPDFRNRITKLIQGSEDKMDSSGALVSQYVSSANALRYVSILPESRYMHKVQSIKDMIVLVVLVELIAGILLSFLLARNNYKPIQRIVNQLRHSSGIESPVINELAFIESITQSTLEKNKNISEALKRQQPIVQASILEHLTKGNAESYKNIHQSLERLGIHFPHNRFCVVTVCIEDCSLLIKEHSLDEYATVRFSVKNVVLELAEREFTAHVIDLDWDQVALIVNLEEQDTQAVERIKSIAAEARDFISEKLLTVITMGIGSIHSGVEGINLSYKESKTALDYRVIKGQGSIISNSDIPRTYTEYFYTTEMETQILNFIGVGDTEKVLELLDKVYKDNFKDREVSMEAARCLLFDMMGTAWKMLAKLDKYNAGLLEAQQLTILQLSSCITIDEMLSTLKTLYVNVGKYMLQNKKNNSIELRDKIIALIHERYGQNNLSLTSVADELDISPTYVSKFFKLQTGINFADYVGKVRMDKAKELLKDPDIPLSDIAVKVGYTNAAYLIRTFKKYENMTPGKYREGIAVK